MIHSTYKVIYTNHVGERTEREVNVHSTTEWDETVYYAEALATLGCGKYAPTPHLAVRTLVQDHGQVIAIQSV